MLILAMILLTSCVMVEEAPKEEAPVEEAPVEVAPVEETPAPVEETPAPVEEAPVEKVIYLFYCSFQNKIHLNSILYFLSYISNFSIYNRSLMHQQRKLQPQVKLLNFVHLLSNTERS